MEINKRFLPVQMKFFYNEEQKSYMYQMVFTDKEVKLDNDKNPKIYAFLFSDDESAHDFEKSELIVFTIPPENNPGASMYQITGNFEENELEYLKDLMIRLYENSHDEKVDA